MYFHFFEFIQVWFNFTNRCRYLQIKHHHLFMALLLVSHLHATLSSNLPLLLATLRTFQVHACDGEELSLKCLPDTFINIYLAQYGRTAESETSSLCPQSFTTASLPTELSLSSANNLSHSVSEVTNCLTTEKIRYALLKKLVASCGEKRVCKIMTDPASFDGIDPCPGIRKYAEVTYKCRPKTFYNKVVCEDARLNLTCTKEHRIVIYSAFFGSNKYGVAECPPRSHYSNKTLQEDCHSNFVTEKVMKMCNGGRSCLIDATRANFGNPGCKDQTQVHLKVVYTCILKEAFKQSKVKDYKDEEEEVEVTKHNSSSSPVTSTLDYSGFMGAPRMEHSEENRTTTIATLLNHQSESFIVAKDLIIKVHDYNQNQDYSKADDLIVTRPEANQPRSFNSSASNWTSSRVGLRFFAESFAAFRFIKDNSDLFILCLLISVSAALLLFFIFFSASLYLEKGKSDDDDNKKTKIVTISSSQNDTENKEITTMDDLLEHLDPIMHAPITDPLSDLAYNTTPHKFKEFLNHQALSNSDSIGFGPSSLGSFSNSTLPNSNRNSFVIKSANSTHPKALSNSLNSYF